MRVIFLADVPGSGQAGDVKEVRNGFARNHLLPKRLATVATHDQLQRLEAIRKAGEERRIKEEQDLTALAEQLSETTVNLTARVGPTGRFYGSVASQQIAAELARTTERDINRRMVHLGGAIQEPGDYRAEVRLPHGITAQINVSVQGRDIQGRVVGRSKEEAAEAVQATMEGRPVAETPETPEPSDTQAEATTDESSEGVSTEQPGEGDSTPETEQAETER